MVPAISGLDAPRARVPGAVGLGAVSLRKACSVSDPRDPRPRLDDLEARIRAARGRDRRGHRRGGGDGDGDGSDTDGHGDGPGRGAGMGLGMRIGVEMVVSVAVGAGIGYLLDRWLGTAPLMMVLFLFLGAGAGVSNVYRVVRGLDEGVGLGRAIEDKQRRERAEAADRDAGGK